MDKKILSWLMNAGLDETRAQLYMSALSSGETTAKNLAEAVSMPRTAVYDNLRVLEQKGFVRAVRHGKRKTYAPLPPKELLKKIENQKKQLTDLLPELVALYAGEKEDQPFTQLFEGEYAAREVYEDILNNTKKVYLYFSPS